MMVNASGTPSGGSRAGTGQRFLAGGSKTSDSSDSSSFLQVDVCVKDEVLHIGDDCRPCPADLTS